MIRKYSASGKWGIPSELPGRRFDTFQDALQELVHIRLKKKKLKVDSCRQLFREIRLPQELLQRSMF